MAMIVMIPARISPMLMSARIDWPLSFFNKTPGLTLVSMKDAGYLDIFPDVVDHHNETEAGRTVADRGEVEIQHPRPLSLPVRPPTAFYGGEGRILSEWLSPN